MPQEVERIDEADKVVFSPISEAFFKKHGRKRCTCCRETGIERIVEIGPTMSAYIRKEAAV